MEQFNIIADCQSPFSPWGVGEVHKQMGSYGLLAGHLSSPGRVQIAGPQDIDTARAPAQLGPREGPGRAGARFSTASLLSRGRYMCGVNAKERLHHGFLSVASRYFCAL